MTDNYVRALLEDIGSPVKRVRRRAEREFGELLIEQARGAAGRWKRSAGSIEGAAVGGAWEELMRSREALLADPQSKPLAAVRCTLSRWYVAEAGAIQTGMGDPLRGREYMRSVVERRRDAQGSLGLVELADDLTVIPPAAGDVKPERPQAGAWLRVLTAVLLRAGWAWPVPAGTCLLAIAGYVETTGRRGAPSEGLSASGVPAATWSALALLVAGSGPGCAMESSWAGARALYEVGGARAVRESAEVCRISRAAVGGKAVRSGRTVVRSRVLAGAA